MIVSSQHQVTNQKGVQSEGSFAISLRNQAHLMTILRDTLYSDKILAVLREYSANAWDAHRQSGCKDIPIRVTLPTHAEPTLVIRDFGSGLSEEDLYQVYTQYGESTKRESNETVGYLGIGCLLAGQPIVTMSGVTPVEQVSVGDLVLTHRGRFRRVYETMTRKHVGKACRVYLSQGSKPLVLTSEHPILVSDHMGNTRWVRPCDLEGGYRGGTKGVHFWKEYAVLPACLDEVKDSLNIKEILGTQYHWEDGCCVRTTSFTNFSRKNKPNTVQTHRVTRYTGLPESVPMTEELGWVLGIYAAEGSATKKQIIVSLNIAEEDIAARVVSGMKAFFGFNLKVYRRPEKSILELVCHSVPAASLMSALCGRGSANKHVPEAVFLGTSDFRRGFLRGVFDGDGSSTRSRFVFGVASPNLAWGVRTLMHTTEGKWGTVGYMPKYERWSVQYNREAGWTYSMCQGDYVLRPILKVETFDLDSDVFNFSVEEDESYVSDFVLHNSKSAFAYSDSFLITSHHDGVRSIYCAVLDESNIGEVKRLSQTVTQETGLEIRIPCRIADISVFEARAQSLYQHFIPQPEINISIAPLRYTYNTPYGSIRPGTGHWVVVMGCVPYRLDPKHLRMSSSLQSLMASTSGYLKVALGDVAVNASREELKYGDLTNDKIVDVFSRMLEDCWEQVAAAESAAQTTWDKLLVQKRSAFLWDHPRGLSVPVQVPSGWRVPNYRDRDYEGHTLKIPVAEDTRVVLVDTRVSYRRYAIGDHDIVLSGKDMDALEEFLKPVAGIPRVNLSSLDVIDPLVPRHTAKENWYLLRQYDSSTLAGHWADVSEIYPTDVWLPISRYQVYGTIQYEGFVAERLEFSSIAKRVRMAQVLNLPVPRFIGYRRDKPSGVVTFDDWNAILMEVFIQSNLFQTLVAYETEILWGPRTEAGEQAVLDICPEDDPLRVWFQRSPTRLKDGTWGVSERFPRLSAKHPQSPRQIWDQMLEKYPMLGLVRGFSTQLNHPAVVEYLRLKNPVT